MLSKGLPVTLALAIRAAADVEFISPLASARLTPGQISISWQDSGVAPLISQLKSYTIELYTGGNVRENSKPVSNLMTNGQFSSGNSFVGIIPSGGASDLTNGFFIKMTSVLTEGGIVINYSDRFSISGFDESNADKTPQAYIDAVQALKGASKGPATEYEPVVKADGNAAAPAAGGLFAIPYNLQTGLTRYAPMQPIPATKITRKDFTPLFPTSAYTLATAWLPRATIVTTATLPQTFSASSIENPASAQSSPTGDMAKFLARWRD